MTKGNFVLITNTANWMSIQFNGDMYPSGNGKLVYHMLESVETYNDLTAAILRFDKERFGYSDEYGLSLAPKSISDDINFSEDYFAIYNSDYLYIKNASDKECTIIAKNGAKQTIKPGEIQVWDFGRPVQPDAEDLELNNDEKKFVYGSEPKGTYSKPENDSVNLRSPSPSPQGLTNDDEVGVQSVDGVSDSPCTSSDLRTDGQPEVGRGLPSIDNDTKICQSHRRHSFLHF